MTKLTWLAALAALPPALSAQTLRERFAERRAERQAADGGSARSTESFTLPSGASMERDIAYGSDPAQRMDVYRPANAKDAPVMFVVHGGAWRRGDKAAQGVVRNKVAYWVGKGFVLVSVAYRLLPEAKPLEQANDVAKALAFAQSKAPSWGGDPARFVLMGHSAGAHLVSLISADPTIATRLGAKPWLATISIDSAAFDVVEIMRGRHLGLYDNAFANDPEVWRESSPTHRLTGKLAAPLLAICSTRRNDACPQARGFAAKAATMGGAAVTVLPQDMTHMELNDLLGVPGPYTEAVSAFLRSAGLP